MQVHWLSLTIHAPSQFAHTFYGAWLEEKFGPPVHRAGANYYTASLRGLEGVAVYYSPMIDGQEHFSMILPGSACECLSWAWFVSLGQYLDGTGFDWSCSRLDLAWDDFLFSPRLVYDLFTGGRVRSLLTVSGWYDARGHKDDMKNGQTFAIGNRASSRYVRFYDARGTNRVEIELKHGYAKSVFSALLAAPSLSEASLLARQTLAFTVFFLDVDRREDSRFISWVQSGNSALGVPSFIIPSPYRRTLQSLKRWLWGSVAVALSVACDCDEEQNVVGRLLSWGRYKRAGPGGRRYTPLLRAWASRPILVDDRYLYPDIPIELDDALSWMSPDEENRNRPY